MVPDMLSWEGFGLIVDKMRERGWFYHLRYVEVPSAQFLRVGLNPGPFEAPTLPAAVFRAAWAALGIEG